MDIDLSKPQQTPVKRVIIEEETFEVVPVGKRVRCPKCKLGYMILDPSAPMIFSNPPLFPHRCDKCGATERYPKQYPTIEFMTPNEEPVQEESANEESNPSDTGTNILL